MVPWRRALRGAGKRLAAAAEARRAAAAYQQEYARFDEETVAAVDKFREEQRLNYAGTPPGLVDERLVQALRRAYFARPKAQP